MTGRQLKQIIDHHELTQSNAAAMMGVTDITISRAINKHRNPISKALAKKATKLTIEESKKDLVATQTRLNDIFNQLYNFTSNQEA